MISVLLADDHAIFRESLKHLLNSTGKYEIVGESGDAVNVLPILNEKKVDVLILDLAMGHSDYFDLIKRIKIHYPKLPIVILSMHDEIQLVRNILATGVAAYVSKNCDFSILTAALEKALAGGKYISPKISEQLILSLNKKDLLPHQLLTPREFHIFSMLGKGVSITMIAASLSLSAKTISSHKARIMQKMGLKNNADLVKYYLHLDESLVE